MEKSFNRADVFKRHLMAVHNVEQTPPNGRKKTATGFKQPSGEHGDYANGVPVSGKCSTCGITFGNAQQFYEHLDECVLSQVVQEEPAAEFNEKNLGSIKPEEVEAVLAGSTTKRSRQESEPEEDGEDDDDYMDADDVDDDDGTDETFTMGTSRTKTGRTPSTRSRTGKH
jgi:hypothetical protein